jgi:hypothetical protein
MIRVGDRVVSSSDRYKVGTVVKTVASGLVAVKFDNGYSRAYDRRTGKSFLFDDCIVKERKEV